MKTVPEYIALQSLPPNRNQPQPAAQRRSSLMSFLPTHPKKTMFCLSWGLSWGQPVWYWVLLCSLCIGKRIKRI